MTNLNNYEELYNHFFNVFTQIIKESKEIPMDKISYVIQEKLMFLGQKSLESIIRNETGNGFSKTHIKDSNDNTVYTYNGLVSKTYISLFGQITLNRAYYYNKEKKKGVFPIEQKYSFLKDVCMPEVKELICYATALEPYAQAKEVLKKLTRIDVSTSEIQKTTKEIGNQLVVRENDLIIKPEKYKKPKKKIDKMAISMDGAMINTFEGWKEVKTGVIYEFYDKNESIKSKNKTYISRIEDCNNFRKRIKQEARKRHYLDANELIVIGDGAKWIWELANKEFPFATQIVDWYHAKQHLYNIISLLYKDINKNDAVVFSEECFDLLYMGDIRSLEEKIILKRIEKNIIDIFDDFISIQTEIEYFRKNEKRMQYNTFKEKGYPIGSGIVEAACKQLVQLRLKRNGMKWTKKGAHCILQIRCHYLGKRWDEVKKIIWRHAA